VKQRWYGAEEESYVTGECDSALVPRLDLSEKGGGGNTPPSLIYLTVTVVEPQSVVPFAPVAVSR
jgi:hypothetical protein